MVRKNRIIAGLLAGVMALSLLAVPGKIQKVEAAELRVLETNVSKPTEGNIMIGIEGTFYSDYEMNGSTVKNNMLNLMNKVRKEAYDEHLEYPLGSGKHLGVDYPYVPLKWSSQCESIARIRAAENGMLNAHSRPNGTSCFMTYNGLKQNSEIIAWNDNIAEAIYSENPNMGCWYAEKAYYNITDSKTHETGHYVSMISPDYKYVGVSAFNSKTSTTLNGAFLSIVGEFSSSSLNLSQTFDGINGSYIQKVEVRSGYVTPRIIGSNVVNVGESAQFDTRADININGFGATDCRIYSDITWTSSDKSVATVDSSGKVTSVGEGVATITATINDGNKDITFSTDFVVLPKGVTVITIEDPEAITVETGTKPDMPDKVKANLSNGDTIYLNVTWDNISNDPFYKESYCYWQRTTFDVKGVALDTVVKQRITVIPMIRYINLEYETVTVESGTKPVYPKATAIVLTNNLSYSSSESDGNHTLSWSDDRAYMKREGGTFTAYGTYWANNTKKAEVKLIVKPATVKDVTFDETALTTPSGKEPIYPEATVTWSNGDVTKEPISWDETESFTNAYKKRAGGSYKITGKFYDTINKCFYEKKTTTVQVNVTPATVSKVEFDDTDIKVENGIKPVLPQSATVSWSNGDVETDRTINWETIPFENYNNMTGGQYTVNGTVDGETVSVKYIVDPPEIKSLEQLSSIKTLEGVVPVLPKEINVTWNNGRKTTENIEWSNLRDDAFDEPGSSVIVVGGLKDRLGTDNSVFLQVFVIPKSLTGFTWCDESGNVGDVKGPSLTDFYEEYDWSKISGKLLASYDNGTSEIIDINDSRIEISGYDSSSIEKSQKVQISYTYEGYTTVTKSVSFGVKLHLPERLNITPPTKLEYIQGQYLDTTGLVVETIYDDGTYKSSLGLETDYGVTEIQKSSIGVQKIYVNQDGIIDSFEINVIPKVATKIEVSEINPQKIEKELNVGSSTIKVTYNDGDVKTKTLSGAILSGDVTISGYNKSTLGKQIVVIGYDEADNPYDTTLTARKTIEVKDKILVGLEIVSFPKKSQYIEGQDLELDGAKVEYLYDNDTTEIVDVTSAIISGYDKNRIGDQEITVSKDGFADAFVVNVRAKKIVKRYLVEPTRTKYLEGDALDLTGGYIYTSYDNGTEDEISLSDSRVVVKLYASGFFLDEIPEVDMSKMPEGYHALDVRFSGISIMNEKGYFPEIEVKAPVRGADLSPAEGTVTSFPAGANDETLVNAMAGVTVSVPCADGTTSSLVITKDMIAGVETVEGDDSDVIIKKIKVKVGEKTGSEGEEIIDPETGLVDNGIYAYIEVQVARPEPSKPDAPGNTTPSNPDDSSSGNSGNVTPSNPESGKNTGVSSENSTSGSNEAKYEVDSDGVKYLVLSEMKASDIKTNVSVSDKKSQGKYKISKVTKKNGKIIGGTVIYMKPYNKNCKTANIKASIKLAGVTFKVTSINKNAFKNSKKLTKVTIGSNISKIGKTAFYGCKKLKTITIKTSKLKSKSIGSKAFKGIYKKAVIKVPKKKLKSYKTYFKKAGAPKTSKIKK